MTDVGPAGPERAPEAATRPDGATGGPPGGAPEVGPSFDRFARLVRRVLECPLSTVTIIEQDRQLFVGADGLPAPLQESRETPLSHSFCQYVAADQEPLVVADAREDSRLHANPAIEEAGVVAYAGWPLRDYRGRVIGSLCAIDHEPRTWTDHEVALLEDLAAACSAEIAQWGLRAQAVAGEAEARSLTARSGLLLALSEDLSATHTIVDVAAAVVRIAHERLGCLRAGIWLRAPDPDASPVALPALADGPRESLTWVDPGIDPWRSAQRHAELPLDAANPLGLTLQRRVPMFLPSRAAQDAAFPGLVSRDQIGQARAFVPLVVRGHAYGVLVLLWDTLGDVDDDEQVTIAALAAYAAQALQRAVLVQERHDAMGTLQSSMMTRLPDVPGLTLAARYLPAASRDQVGGDWYDAVATSHEVSLVVGDVVGHDIEAAATMGQLRSMLRTLAWSHEESAAATIGQLDRAVRDLGMDALATLLLAQLAPHPDGDVDSWKLCWATAGHPPPLVLDPDGTARFLDGRADLMLGVRPDTERHDHHSLVAAGSTVLLCTDGLFERRGEDIGAGLERLRRAVEAHAHLPLERLLDAVRDELVGTQHSDDVALLAARLDPQR